jgi:hypothetical protein
LLAAMMQRRISETRFAHIYFENEAFRFSFVAQRRPPGKGRRSFDH